MNLELIESVYEISESFMKNPVHVEMDEEQIQVVGNDMIDQGISSFPLPDVESDYKGVLLELVAASVNYCYWYGKHDIRPNGSSSTTMYEALQNAFFDYEERDPIVFETCITRFIKLLSTRRFPLIEERERHLRQLLMNGEAFAYLVNKSPYEVSPWLDELIVQFPGFASDIFLKRASLFFIQLFRRFGWFESDLHNLHVPADYQIPKMLNYFGCLIYQEDLYDAIKTNQIIPKHSQPECEIRAATVLIIKKLCEMSGWNVAEVDGFFFTKRHEADRPFHLCITTDY